MRKLFLLILILFSVAVCQAQQTTFTPVCSGSNDTAKFTTIISTIGSNTGTIRLPYKNGTRCAVTSLSIPANVTLDNSDGTGISRSGVLTIVGPVVSPVGKQLFYGAGTTVFTGNVTLGDIYPQWWGAKGDDSTDSTAAFQAMLHVAEYNGSLGGARFFIPNGTYQISSTLTYRGDYGHRFVMEGSNQGEANNNDGPIFKWVGAAGGTIMQWLGANWCQMNNVQFAGNGLALRDLLIDYDASRSQSSFDCQIDNCTFGGNVGVNSCNLVLGTSAFASAEHLIQGCKFSGHSTAGTTYYGVASLGSANCKNFTVRSSDFIGFKWGYKASNSGYHMLDGCSFSGSTEGDVKPVGGNMSVTNFGSEGSTRLIDDSGGSSTVAGSLLLSNGYFAGSGDSNQYIVIYPGKLTVQNCQFGAGPSLGDNPPKFKVSITVAGASGGGGVISQNNLYDWNAATTSDFIPFYDTSDRLIGTLAQDDSSASLESFGDAARILGSFVNFPSWSLQGNIGVRPKVILTAFWGSNSTYAIRYGDSAVLTECATGPFGTGYNTIDLGSPAVKKGRRHRVIKTDNSAFPIAVTNGFAFNINGTSMDRVMLVKQHDFVDVESDGTSWRVVAQGNVITTAYTITSTLATGTAPLVVASTTKVTNLNADKLDGQDWSDPGSIGSGTPAAATFTSITATGTTFPSIMIVNDTIGGGTVPLSATRYTWGSGTITATESSTQTAIPIAGAFKTLYVTTTNAQTGTGSLVFTLRKNGVDTAITVTVAAGASGGTFSDTAHSVTFAAGDLASIGMVNNGTATSATISGISLSFRY